MNMDGTGVMPLSNCKGDVRGMIVYGFKLQPTGLDATK